MVFKDLMKISVIVVGGGFFMLDGMKVVLCDEVKGEGGMLDEVCVICSFKKFCILVIILVVLLKVFMVGLILDCISFNFVLFIKFDKEFVFVKLKIIGKEL